MSYPDSYYARTAKDDRRRAALSATIEAEVCVLGGGLAGIATGLDLAERGRRVAVLERHQVGWGASGRSGGFVAEGFVVDLPILQKKLGKDAALALFELSRVGHRLVRERIERYGIDCDAKSSGGLSCALRERDEGLESYCNLMHQTFGIELEYWPRQRVCDALACSAYGDAIHDPRTFSVHPLNLTRGLARAFESGGGLLFEDTPALRVTDEGAQWVVTSPHGRVRAQHIVIACGGYIGGLSQPLSNATVPVATDIVVTEPLGDFLDKAIAVPHAISDIQFLPNYYRKLSDGRLLWGGRASAWEPGADRIRRLLSSDLRRLYPSLASAKIETAWSGQMSYLAHEMPSIGSLGRGAWYATGFGGLGMASTTMAGRLIASAIVEGDDQWRRFAPFGLPFAGGRLLVRVLSQLNIWGRQVSEALHRK